MIWLPILPTDARDEWDDQLLADARVTHLWDQDRAAGRWLADDQNIDLGYDGEILWDAFLLFGPEAHWESTPSELLAWGTPIVGRFPELADALAPLLENPTGAGSPTPEADLSGVFREGMRFVFTGQREGFRNGHARSVAA